MKKNKYSPRAGANDVLISVLHMLLVVSLVLLLMWWITPREKEPVVHENPDSSSAVSEPMLWAPEDPTPNGNVSCVEPDVVWAPDPDDVELLAKLIWGEARGASTMEQAAVVWCVLNRVDSGEHYFPDTIREVVLQKGQFTGYKSKHPVTEEFKALAEDVLHRWHDENDGIGPACSVGRVLPAEYVYFHSAGLGNTFRKTLKRDGNYWDWDVENPYEGVWH